MAKSPRPGQREKALKLRRTKVLKQIRDGKYGADGYPLDSPALREGFEEARQGIGPEVEAFDKLYKQS